MYRYQSVEQQEQTFVILLHRLYSDSALKTAEKSEPWKWLITSSQFSQINHLVKGLFWSLDWLETKQKWSLRIGNPSDSTVARTHWLQVGESSVSQLESGWFVFSASVWLLNTIKWSNQYFSDHFIAKRLLLKIVLRWIEIYRIIKYIRIISLSFSEPNIYPSVQ